MCLVAPNLGLDKIYTIFNIRIHCKIMLIIKIINCIKLIIYRSRIFLISQDFFLIYIRIRFIFIFKVSLFIEYFIRYKNLVVKENMRCDKIVKFIEYGIKTFILTVYIN